MQTFVQSVSNSVHNYTPNHRHLAGLVVVLIGSLFCLWLDSSLDIWSNGHIVGLSSLTLAILLGMILGNTIYPKFTER
ncbi:MAG: YeiH family putative sulfate export transporter, partial [Psychrobacter sp.]